MPEERIIEVIVPESLKDPIKFDLWRLRVDNDKNLIFDFAKKESDNQMSLISSILLENNRIDRFVNEFLLNLYINNEQHNLDLELFRDSKSQKGRNKK